MKYKINDLMAVSAILASAPFYDSADYADTELSELNTRTIAHVRTINYDEVVAENMTDFDTLTEISPGWWVNYLC